MSGLWLSKIIKTKKVERVKISNTSTFWVSETQKKKGRRKDEKKGDIKAKERGKEEGKERDFL